MWNSHRIQQGIKPWKRPAWRLPLTNEKTRQLLEGLPFGLFKGASKSVQVLLKGIEAVMALTLIILKQRALHGSFSKNRGPNIDLQ